MAKNCTFHAGDRVRVRGNPMGITMSSKRATILRTSEFTGYYWLRLDKPATQWDTNKLVTEIVEAGFNLIPISE